MTSEQRAVFSHVLGDVPVREIYGRIQDNCMKFCNRQVVVEMVLEFSSCSLMKNLQGYL